MYVPQKKRPVSVSVIVLSYNRPRMLAEALASIEGADEVLLLDDASDFDVRTLAAAQLRRFKRSDIRIAPSISLEGRLKTPRLGKAINEAIQASQCDVITYLCDDDLFHKDWISDLRNYFTKYRYRHCVRGGWGVFNDGEKPGDKICPLSAGFDMTTGNFAHRKGCSLKHNVWWDETSIAIHDAWFFVKGVFPSHPLRSFEKLPGLAGWRREHKHNMFQHTDSDGYLSTAEAVLRKGMLE